MQCSLPRPRFDLCAAALLRMPTQGHKGRCHLVDCDRQLDPIEEATHQNQVDARQGPNHIASNTGELAEVSGGRLSPGWYDEHLDSWKTRRWNTMPRVGYQRYRSVDILADPDRNLDVESK